MATQTTLLQNPNAATQQNPQNQALAPMQQTTATQPTTQAPPPPTPGGVAKTTAQQVAPKPGDKPLLVGGSEFAQSVQDYEQALGFDPAIHSVQGQMEGLLSSDNKYIQQARNRASMESAARGLRNSSIAVQAGEEAAISQALPIAQADAELQMQSRLAAFGAAVEDQMLQKQHGFDLEKIAVEFENNKALAEQAFGFNKELTHIEGGYQMKGIQMQTASAEKIAADRLAADKAMQQAGFQFQSQETEKQNAWQAAQNQLEQDFKASQAGLDREQQTLMANTEMSWKTVENQLDRELQTALNEMKITAEQKGALSGHFTNMMISADSAISNVLMSDLKAADKQREIARIQAQTQANWKALQDYYNSSEEVFGGFTW